MQLLIGSWLLLMVGSCSAIAASAIELGAAVLGFRSAEPLTLSLPLAVPGASFSLFIDGLPGLHWLFYNLLILSMSLVVTAAHSILFLFAWECMSLSSFFLVIGDHEDNAVTRAGWIYLLATHLGATLLFVFFLVAGTLSASFDFSAFGALRQISPLFASGLFLLILFGFGSKAGLFPFHVWLPEAHPAASSRPAPIWPFIHESQPFTYRM